MLEVRPRHLEWCLQPHGKFIMPFSQVHTIIRLQTSCACTSFEYLKSLQRLNAAISICHEQICGMQGHRTRHGFGIGAC